MINNRSKGLIIYIIAIIGLFAALYISSRIGQNDTASYGFTSFKSEVDAGNVLGITIYPNEEVPTGTIEFTVTSGKSYSFYSSDVREIEQIAREKNISYYMDSIDKPSVFLTTVLPYIIIALLFVFMMVILSRPAGGSNSKLMDFGKSRAQMVKDISDRFNFKSVAGLIEEKEELAQVVDFLKEPRKYALLGARIPKGILLEGPPGTGKTLLAKAVAGEAKVPFFSISGSDFVEMFVGVGASRVRDLFMKAKQNSPCIIFIDEIDAVARRRGAGMGGGHDEREQTLNQMLVEMDGFESNQGIIVMAATNRVDILDPAILRPGRFDRKIIVSRPDVRGREEILKVHVRNKPLGEDIDLPEIARTTAGFTGADLENLMNEAAINAATHNRAFITDEDVKKSLIRVGIGSEKKSRIISPHDRKITAYHEAGHAILFHLLPDEGPVYTVSVIPTGQGAAGYTMPLPDKDNMHYTKGKLRQDIIVNLGGRAAESLIFDDITTGASQDIKNATSLARDMVTRFGFSDSLGLVCYASDDEEVFIGRDYGHTKRYSEDTAGRIDAEVRTIIDECFKEARRIITENLDVLHRCAALLVDKERITGSEFEALFNEPALESDPE